MKIAVVGPTHPLKGGVSQHTTVLARRLAAAGHDVQIVSWARQYPNWLYPGRQEVDAPEFRPFHQARRRMRWSRPDTWVREAWRLRASDLVVFAHVTPFQVPPQLAMIMVLGRRGPVTAVICHNVLPHERRWFDPLLVRRLLRAVDQVIVHSPAELDLARSMTGRPVVEAALAPFMPEGFARGAPRPGEHRRLLFFGLVRPYKGLDVLLKALAKAPADVRLRIAGEMWGDPDAMLQLCEELHIRDRVEIRAGYVPAGEVPRLFDDVDALVLPYRSATGSQGVWTGFEFGVPVIASRAGHLADGIRDGVDGLVVEPGDEDDLADALHRFYQPGVPERMRTAVKPVDPEPYWDRYLTVLVDAARPEGANVVKNAPTAGKLLTVAKIGAEEVLWARVAAERAIGKVRRAPRRLPDRVPPTEVLGTVAASEQAVDECRQLHLPLHHDRPKNWDSLGAVSTVLNDLGLDIRVLDAGAARYSPILPWLRIYGVRDLVGNNLEFRRTSRHGPVRFEPGDIVATGYPDGWFDAVTCMSVIEHGVDLGAFAVESARLLRPGGMLIVSTDYDQQPPDTRGKFAYGTSVHIFGPEDIQRLVKMAAEHGLALIGDLQLQHAARPVHWRRTGLDYTFIRLTFIRA